MPPGFRLCCSPVLSFLSSSARLQRVADRNVQGWFADVPRVTENGHLWWTRSDPGLGEGRCTTMINSPSESASPVFVVGCARSGTTLLYHMLVSSGGFANYRAETHLYDMILPRYGSLESPRERLRLLRAWCSSRQAGTVDLGEDDLRDAVLEDCRSGGDFLRILMDNVAKEQGVHRWAECTPLHLLYMDRIKREIPDALFLHIIRDGRDVALSLAKVGWVNPLPWDRAWEEVVAAWEWEWRIQAGRELGHGLGADYREVRFEDLVGDPEQTLESLEEFVGYPLDYDVIMENAVGTVSSPNTAFEDLGDEAGSHTDFSPLGRWRDHTDRESIAGIEATVGNSLKRLGYQLKTVGVATKNQRTLQVRKHVYQAYRGIRQWAKDTTPLSRWLTRSYLDRA